MANPCFNHIVFEGSPENLHSLVEYINNTFWEKPEGVITELLRLEEMVPKESKQPYYHECGSAYFEVLTLEVYSFRADTNALHQPVELSSDFEKVFLHGESAYTPTVGLTSILCTKFQLTAEHVYEEGRSLYGKATVDAEGGYTNNEFVSFWEGVAVIDPDDYIERAQLDYDDYFDEEDFKTSEIWKYCPADEQQELLQGFKEHLEPNKEDSL